MKKYILPILSVILAFAYFVFISTFKYDFDPSEPMYDWVQVGGLAFLVYILLSLFLKGNYRFIIWIPGFLYVGFIIAFLMSNWSEPNIQNPFGEYSVFYMTIVSYSLIVFIDAFTSSIQGFKLFLTVMLSALIAYGFINFYYEIIEIHGYELNSDFYFSVFMIFMLFIAPYFIMLFNQIFLYVNREKFVKEKAEVPYNRYRPEIKPDIVEPEKTLAQTQREKNAIRGLTLLYEAGLLSDEEFERKKKKVLSSK
jgi:hypothetical protein